MKPKDIKIFSLLYKEEKYKFDIKIDWYGTNYDLACNIVVVEEET